MIRDLFIFFILINAMIYYIVQEIITVKEKNREEAKKLVLPSKKKVPKPTFVKKDENKLVIPSKKKTPKPTLVFEYQDPYDFNTPKDGKAKSIADGGFLRLNNQQYKEKNYNTIIGWSSSAKNTFAMAAPSTSAEYYFINAYLNGYVPYKTKSVWQPLEALRLRFKYKLDDVVYNKRPEVWQTSRESFIKLRGDCEDHAIALADWLIGQGYDARVAIGTVKFRGQPAGGHAWVVLFNDNKEYLLEATRKQKWNMLPLASTMPYYFPTEMFNREDTWTNKGSNKTTKYSGEMWIKSGKFVPYDSYYPDLKTHRLFIDSKPSDATVKIMNIKKKFSQGVKLRTGSYYIKITKEGFKTEEFSVSINYKDLHVIKNLIKL